MQKYNSKITILIGFIAVVTSVVVVGITGLNQLSRLNAKQDAITSVYDTKRDLVYQMLSSSRERVISLTLMVNMADPFDRDAEYMRYNQLGTRFAEARQALMQLPLDSAETTLLELQGNAVHFAIASQRQLIDAISAEDSTRAAQLLANRVIPWQQKIFGLLQQLADIQRSHYHEEFKSTAINHSRAYLMFIAMLAVIATTLGGIITYLVIRHIQRTESALSSSNERFELAMRGANDGLWDWNIQSDEVFYSPRWKEMLGYAPDEVNAQLHEWETRVHPDDRLQAEIDIKRHLDGETELYQNRHRMRTKDGCYRWHLERGICVRDKNGTPLRMVGTTTDITEQELAEDALFAEKERALVTLHSIGDAVLTTDKSGRVSYLNPAAELLTGWLSEEALGKTLDELVELRDEASHAPLENPVTLCLRSGRLIQLEAHALMIDRDGREKPVADSAAPIRDRDGTIIGAVMVFRDVSESRRMAQQMTWQASHDSLTGLINRRELERRLQQLIDSAQFDSSSHAFLYLDLDQFKIVNDTSGHIAGDELLRQLGFLLHDTIRDTDTLARLGGDEFGILLRGCPEEKAREIAETLHKTVREFRFVWQDKTFEVGASIGLVMIGPDSESTQTILSNADMACYAAKDQGRNRIQLYQPDDQDLVRRHNEMRWVAEIKQGLENNRFILYRQGIALCRSNNEPIRHAEILVRMLDENGGLVPPAQFITAAERYNLMPSIDRWVISNAFEYIANHPNSLDVMSINLSGNSFSNDDFLGFIHSELRRCNVPPRKICFEITETAAISNLSAAVHFMRELKQVGIRFALDDFGSGLSSFAYLKNLPVDSVKIDGAFIKDMADDPIDRAMVEAINSIGKVMGIKTIAEFVENEKILRLLQHIGVDMVQGYHIEKPRPLLEAVSLIRATDVVNR